MTTRQPTKLYSWRLAQGLSRKKAARMFGMTEYTLAQLEFSPTSQLQTRTVVKLARHFGAKGAVMCLFPDDAAKPVKAPDKRRPASEAIPAPAAKQARGGKPKSKGGRK